MSDALLQDILVELRALNARLDAPLSNSLAVTVKETEVLLGCSRVRVFEMLAAGDLQRAPKTGKQTRILRSSIDAYLEPTAVKRGKQGKGDAAWVQEQLAKLK